MFGFSPEIKIISAQFMPDTKKKKNLMSKSIANLFEIVTIWVAKFSAF